MQSHSFYSEWKMESLRLFCRENAVVSSQLHFDESFMMGLFISLEELVGSCNSENAETVLLLVDALRICFRKPFVDLVLSQKQFLSHLTALLASFSAQAVSSPVVGLIARCLTNAVFSVPGLGPSFLEDVVSLNILEKYLDDAASGDFNDVSRNVAVVLKLIYLLCGTSSISSHDTWSVVVRRQTTIWLGLSAAQLSADSGDAATSVFGEAAKLTLTVGIDNDSELATILREAVKTVLSMPVDWSDPDSSRLEQCIKTLQLACQLWMGFPGTCDISAMECNGLRMTNVRKLLQYELTTLYWDDSEDKQTAALSPALVVLHMAAADPRIRVDLSRETFDKEGGLLDLMIPWMTSSNLSIRRLVSELLFVLCDSNRELFIQRTGFGNAVGLLQAKGLLHVSGSDQSTT